MKNKSASIKAKLLNLSRSLKTDYMVILRRYSQERFIFRLSKSIYKNNFVLKGAIMSLVFGLSNFRPTKDIDFLGVSISNDMENIKKIIMEIISVNCDDGIKFQKKLEINEIRKEADYRGLRIIIPWKMEKTNNKLQIDIGFGDKIIEGPMVMNFPTLINDEEPEILIYSLETAIAEKIQIITSLNFNTSRLKDFYDLYMFCSKKEFNFKSVYNSLAVTFKTRKTNLEDIRIVFSDDFINNEDKSKQ